MTGLVAEQRAKKSLGQHFLRDGSVLSRICGLMHVEPGDQIIEIGPGPGALTALLRPLPWKRLLLLEKDDTYAAAHGAIALPGMEVISGDAMLFPWETLEGPWKIAGNLPYNVASPLMWDIARRVPHLERAVFMVQKEVADRILAAPGSREYGALSVWLQSFCVPQKGFAVPPSCFAPPPKVYSAVLSLLPLQKPRPADPDALAAIIKICFGQRRKQIQSTLRRTFGSETALRALDGCGIPPEVRPEVLPPEAFQLLASRLLPGGIPGRPPAGKP